MKKYLSIFLAALMVLLLAGCGTSDSDADATTPTPDPTMEATPEPTPDPTPEPTPEVSTQPDVSDDEDEEDFLPAGPVGGGGFSSLDSTIYLLSSTLDGSAVYDPEANCIISIVPVDGFVQTFLTSYAKDAASAVERWESTKSNYCNLDNATRKLIDVSCNVKVDTMFVLVDNEQEYEYVMMIQNGEVTYCLIDDFINQMQ